MPPLRSEKQLKQTRFFDFLWLTVKNLRADVRDFKLQQEKRPVFLAWKPLTSDTFAWSKGMGKKKTWKKKQLQSWARFLWESQMLGFQHVTQALQVPYLGMGKKGKKARQPNLNKVPPPAKVPAILRAFFSSFNWLQMQPGLRSVGVKSYQAFGAETPARGKGQHHAVIWVNRTVRKDLHLKQKQKLKKHRYIWLNPMTGARPVSPQLLPLPAKGKPNKLQVPFRPAVLYIFRRPPQKKRKQKQRKRRQKKKNQRMSKRQQVRNRLKNLKEDRNKMLKRMLGKPKRLSGKRG
jgi:hypothetical protein